MKQYLDLVKEVLTQGTAVPSVQGVSCLRLRRVPKMTFDFSVGHPLLTSRDLRGSVRAAQVEFLWMLSGSTDLKPLLDQDVHIWDQWDLPNTRALPQWRRPKGNLGPIYGHQFRNYGATRMKTGRYKSDGVDQIARLMEDMKNNPYDRRLQITTFNPKDLPHQFITCCHGDVHFFIEGGRLRTHHVQRACDLLVGGPFNMFQYAMFTEMVGQCAGYKVTGMEHTIHDCHIYLNQVAMLLDLLYPTGRFDEKGEQIMEIDERVTDWALKNERQIEELYTFDSKLPEQNRRGQELRDFLGRDRRPLPTIKLHPQKTDIFGFKPQDIMLSGYYPHPAIKGIPVLQ